MPKAKPTQVIVHRIELQEKEREMLEPFVKAKEVEQYGRTAATVAAAGALGVAVYVGWWTTDALFGWMNKAGDKLDEMASRLKEYDDQTESDLTGMVKSTSPLARIWLTVNGY